MAIKRYEVVLFPDRASKATFLRVQTQALRGELASSYLFLTVVELVEFLCVSISNDCSHELFKKQILDEENIFIIEVRSGLSDPRSATDQGRFTTFTKAAKAKN